MSKEILVTGGTGKTGGRIVSKLEALNIPVRSGSRKSSPAFDWENSDTWTLALKNVRSVYINFSPDLAVPFAVDVIRDFINEAKNAGVVKLVLLSGRGEKEAAVCEEIVAKSGIDFTILRASWFMQNFSESFFQEGIAARELIIPRVISAEPFIDVDDLAEVAVQALINGGHNNQVYELTGPALLTFRDAAAIISKTINQSIILKEISIKDYAEGLRVNGVPEDFIWLISYLFTEVLDGRNESVTSDVQNILGRPATSFEAFAEKYANLFH